MPWMSIIVWLVSFLLQKSAGVSSGKAALTSTALGAATYYLADPANSDNVLGLRIGAAKVSPGDPAETSVATPAAQVAAASAPSTTSTGSGIMKWISENPLTTAAVAAGTGAALTSSSGTNWLLWGGIGLGALLLLRKT